MFNRFCNFWTKQGKQKTEKNRKKVYNVLTKKYVPCIILKVG